MNTRKKGLLADMSLLLVAILWGGGFIAVKGSLDNITPFYMITMRFGISSLLMCIVFFKKLKKITRKDIIAGIIVGIFLFGGFAFQTIGLQYTTVGKQAFLTATYVVLVPFLYWGVSRKKPDIYAIIAAFLAFFGITMLTLQGSVVIGKGDILTLLCAIMFAAQIVAIDIFTEKIDPIILTITQMIATTVFAFICSILFEPKITRLNTQDIMNILYLAIFSTMIAFLIQNVAQKYTSSTHAAILLSLESFFGCLFGILFLKDIFTTKMVIGCVLIFLSVITAETKWSFFKARKNS